MDFLDLVAQQEGLVGRFGEFGAQFVDLAQRGGGFLLRQNHPAFGAGGVALGLQHAAVDKAAAAEIG